MIPDRYAWLVWSAAFLVPLVLVSPFLVFVALLPLPFNPIYPAITAMVVGTAPSLELTNEGEAT